MRARRVLAVAFGLLAASFAAYALFYSGDYEVNCDNSVPANAAQSAALADARSRNAGVCSHARCQFVLDEDPDSSLRVSLYFVTENFIGSCVSTYQHSEIFIYSREGKFTRIEGAPYE